jgi:hypothetical protein
VTPGPYIPGMVRDARCPRCLSLAWRGELLTLVIFCAYCSEIGKDQVIFHFWEERFARNSAAALLDDLAIPVREDDPR